MVLLIIIPMKNGYFIGGIPHFQTNSSPSFFSLSADPSDGAPLRPPGRPPDAMAEFAAEQSPTAARCGLALPAQ